MQNQQIDNSTKRLKRVLRIEVCGGIASGKTTLVTLLKHAGIDPIFENFQINPFWEAFYTDPRKYAFETEITFLLQHYHQIKVAYTNSKIFACDFSLFLDFAYTEVTLKGSKREAFLAVYDEVRHDLSNPDLLIYLRCGASAELERIRQRGRITEQSIDLEFLSALNNSIERHVDKICDKKRVISIDSERQNFVRNKMVQQDLLNKLYELFPNHCKGCHPTSRLDLT